MGTDSARRYLAIVQTREGYPAHGEPLEAAPPDGPATGMVYLYRHPDTGQPIVEAGASPADDAIIAAMAALGEGGEP